MTEQESGTNQLANAEENAIIRREKLSREDVVVHERARSAFDYFQRFVLNPCLRSADSLHRQPFLEFTRTQKGRFLVASFDELALLPELEKIECFIYETPQATSRQVESISWRYVSRFIRLHPVTPKLLADRIRILATNYPRKLVAKSMPPDPAATPRGNLSQSSLVRRYGLSWNSISKHAGSLDRGLKLPSYDGDIAVRKEGDD